MKSLSVSGSASADSSFIFSLLTTASLIFSQMKESELRLSKTSLSANRSLSFIRENKRKRSSFPDSFDFLALFSI